MQFLKETGRDRIMFLLKPVKIENAFIRTNSISNRVSQTVFYRAPIQRDVIVFFFFFSGREEEKGREGNGERGSVAMPLSARSNLYSLLSCKAFQYNTYLSSPIVALSTVP